MSSPEPTFAISFAYLIVVWTLNRVMRDRAPLQLKWIAVLHNTFLVALSLYMGCEILRNAIVNEFSFVCNRVDRSDAGLPLARVLYIFYISKAYEFIDTFLMAFRKKTAQISFLHLYHHVRRRRCPGWSPLTLVSPVRAVYDFCTVVVWHSIHSWW